MDMFSTINNAVKMKERKAGYYKNKDTHSELDSHMDYHKV